MLHHKKTKVFFFLAIVLAGCLSLQMPMMSYSMDGMDCGTEMTCSSCGCVANSFSSPLSSYFIQISLFEDVQPQAPVFVQEPRILPPKSL